MREDIRRVGRYLLQHSDVDGYVLRIADTDDDDPIRGAELLHVNLRDLIALGEAAHEVLHLAERDEVRRRTHAIHDKLDVDPAWQVQGHTSTATVWRAGGNVAIVPSGWHLHAIEELDRAERAYAESWPAEPSEERP